MTDFNYHEFQKKVDSSISWEILSNRPFGGSLDPSEIEEEFGYVRDQAVHEKRLKGILRKSSVKKSLCQALESFTGDVFEMSKIITPILVSLSLAGTIDLQLDEWIFAPIIIIISKMGVAAICSEDKDH